MFTIHSSFDGGLGPGVTNEFLDLILGTLICRKIMFFEFLICLTIVAIKKAKKVRATHRPGWLFHIIIAILQFLRPLSKHQLIRRGHGKVCSPILYEVVIGCLLYTSPSPRDLSTSRMPSSA